MIVIITATQDLHAILIQEKLRCNGFDDVHIIEVDKIAQKNSMSYGINYDLEDVILTSEGKYISIAEAKIAWLRRTRSNQIFEYHIEDDDAATIANNDCRGGLTGFLATKFTGKWISNPEATMKSADKIFQLSRASHCGFRVPRTLVTQSKDKVREFEELCPNGIIVKTVVGAPKPFLQTVKLTNIEEIDPDAFCTSPAIYQEYIPGSKHLRLNCFGDSSFAALLEATDLDWRGNLNIPIEEYQVQPELHSKVREVLNDLELEMGIVDIKLTPDGEPVWLEVNPQGQFVFLDPLTSMDVADKFAAYLIREHSDVENNA